MFTKFSRLSATAAVAVILSGTVAQAAEGTIVLVHGAFADGSSWSKVIPRLEAHGYEVIAVQLPLTSLVDDAAATNRAIDRAKGPVTLVGHSWGGTVITETGGTSKVKSLVYIAAFANDPGASYQDLIKGYPDSPGGASIVVDKAGFAHLSDSGVSKYFAPDVSADMQKQIAATQGPIRGANFGEKVTTAAWMTKPSWYVVATEDQMIPPALEEAMANKIKAHLFKLKSSHVVMLSNADAVAKIIETAASLP